MKENISIDQTHESTPKIGKPIRECSESLLGKRVSIATDMFLRGAKEAGALGFFPFILSMVTLPHSQPMDDSGKKEEREYSRKNGNLNVGIQSGMSAMPGTGLPYGIIPRLILLKLATQAKQGKSSSIRLGVSMADFIRSLGLTSKGQSYSIVSKQFFRLITSRFFTWDGPGIDSDGISVTQVALIDDAFLWWTPKENKRWLNNFTLSENAYREITNRAVPVDLRGLQDPLIRRSPLAFDLYIWLPWRAFVAQQAGSEARIPWRGLLEQFGAGYSRDSKGMDNFKSKCRMYIGVIITYYHNITIDDSRSDFIIIK